MRANRTSTIACASLLALALCVAAQPAFATDRLAVIVHPARTDTLSSEQVGQIFLKRRRFWANGSTILPVNRDAGSTGRTFFSQRIFGERARRLAVYWNRQYFQGVLPPATMASDASVKAFVQLEARAIGYVDARFVDDTVRVILWLEAR